MDFKGFYDEIIFDVDRSILKSYTGKQGDTKSRGIYVTVTQKNAAIEDLTGLSMRLFYEKPDKTRGFIDGVVDGNKFRIDYTNQIYAVPGVVKAELRLMGADGEIITAKTFKILVDSSIADGSIVSKDERGILDRAFELAEDIIPRLELLDVELLEDVQAEMLGARHSNTKDETYESLGARLEASEQDLLDHKAEYTSNRQQDQLKIAKVEKELNDYKATMQQVNINQEAKQTASGYGIVSLPKNAANGQVSASIFGNTETDEEGNTKSTISAFRIRSVSEDETQESSAYVIATDADTGEILELRSLPNGTKDEINLTQGKATIRTGKLIIGNIGFNDAASYDDNYYRAYKIGILQGLNMVYNTLNSGIGYCTDGNFKIFSNASPTVEVGRGMALYEDGRLYVFVEKSKIDAMSGTTLVDKFNSYFAQYPVTLIYQLAEPEIIPIQVSGSLTSHPNGTVFIEPIVADAGVYTDKIEVLHDDLPIKAIEKVSKVDFVTGIETELDISQAEISEDKLSFTHPDLSEGDIVFFEYEYDVESTEGETEVEFYDSRYVVKDDVTGKFYKWNVKVSNGTPTIEVVEV